MAEVVAVKVVPEIDQLSLRDAVLEVITGMTVVKPGDTLVIRVKDWNAQQLHYYQQDLDARDLTFRVLVVIGDELAVAQAEDDRDLSELTWPEKRQIARRMGQI